MRNLIIFSVLSILLLSCGKITPESQPLYLSEGDLLPQFTAEMSDKVIMSSEEFIDTVGLVLVYDMDKTAETLEAVIPVNDLYKTYDKVFKFCCINASNCSSDAFWEQHSFEVPYSDSLSDFQFSAFCKQTPVLYFVNHGYIRKVWTINEMPSSEELRLFMEPYFHGIVIIFDYDD